MRLSHALRVACLLTGLLAGLLVMAAQSHAASATETGAKGNVFSPTQQDAIGQLVHAYILSHPEVIEQAVSVLASRQEAKEAQTQASMIRAHASEWVVPGVTPVLGNPKGDVTVFMFSDYNCGYCHVMAPLLEQLLQQDPGVRLVIKEWPVLGAESVDAAQTALAANKQGQYPAFHRALMNDQDGGATGHLPEVAQSVGLDLNRLNLEKAAPDVVQEIRSTQQIARDLGIRGTPAFVIGYRVVPAALPLEKLKQIVAEERARPGGSGAPRM